MGIAQQRTQNMTLVEEFFLVSSCLMIVGAATLTSLVILASLKWRSETGSGIVTVVVLGDVGRSPRMQYHSLSLAQFGYEVDIVGFSG